MNVLRIDICSRRSKREVQFIEVLMFKGYQCRSAKAAPQRENASAGCARWRRLTQEKRSDESDADRRAAPPRRCSMRVATSPHEAAKLSQYPGTALSRVISMR
nr:hypothetical protein [Paraburkholderia sp. UYCP14C]